MPRKNRVVLDDTRSSIDAPGIIQLLQDHVFSEKPVKELSTSQLRAAEILLKKIVPDLGSAALIADDDQHPTHIEVTWTTDRTKALPDPARSKPNPAKDA